MNSVAGVNPMDICIWSNTFIRCLRDEETECAKQLLKSTGDIDRLDFGVNTSYKDIQLPGLSTPLKAACYFNNVEIAKYLLDRGVDVEDDGHQENIMPSMFYATRPLSLAADLGHLRMVYLLVGYGADINYRESRGFMHLVLRWRFDGCSPEEADMNSEPYRENNALMKACREHRFDVVKCMLDTGKCNIRLQNHFGNTALHIACCSQSQQRIRSHCDVPDWRPLCFHSSVNLVLMLLLNGFDMEIKNKTGRTPFMNVLHIISSEYGDPHPTELKYELVEVITCLISAGANLNFSHEADDKTIPCGYMRFLSSSVHCLRMLVYGGAKLPNISPDDRQYFKEKNELFLTELDALKSSPLELRHLSRIAIRTHLKKPLFNTVGCLPLPPFLREFLLINKRVQIAYNQHYCGNV